MKNFILKCKPVHSHYNVKHAPNRRYLPVGVNFTGIYKYFKQDCFEKGIKVCSWTHFLKMIQQLNLSTAEPAQDICTKCKNHEMEHKILPRPCNCDHCQDLGKHLASKRNSRGDLKVIEEKCDKSNGKDTTNKYTSSVQDTLYTVDMQKSYLYAVIRNKILLFFLEACSFQ